MGAVLPKPVMTKVIERKGNKNYAVGSCSVNGYRENMEDAHTIHFDEAKGPKNWAMFGVFDGHVSEKCSAYVSQHFASAVQSMGKMPIPDADLQKLALKVDKEWAALQTDGGSTGTWVISHMEGQTYKLQVGNVGDSRVLISRKGLVEAMTNDHKPELPAERRRIEDCGGHVENNRVDGSLAVSRAFGDQDYKRTPPLTDQLKQKVIALADITHTEIQTGADDFIMLICDGVFEQDFTNHQIVEFAAAEMKKTDDIAAVCGLVCEEAISRGSKDNISCMIVKCCNGEEFAKKYAAEECIPGPFACPDSKPFVNAYKLMLNFGHMTLAQALQYRYNYIKSELPKLRAKYKGIKEEDLSIADMRAILYSQVKNQQQRAMLNDSNRTSLLQQIAAMRAGGDPVLPMYMRDMEGELEAFGSGPDSSATPATQLLWFESWATKQMAQSPGAGSGPAGIPGGPQGEMLQRLVTLQQQLGLPLPTLLNLLARDNGRDQGP